MLKLKKSVNTYPKVECTICNTYHGTNVICKHVKRYHGIDKREYYEQHYCKHHPKLFNTDVCIICSGPVEFKNFVVGYVKTCCDKCSGVLRRRNLKADPTKFEKFRNKVSSRKKIWHSNLTAHEKEHRRVKNSERTKALVAKMSPDERKLRFGWMNKLTAEEKQKFIDEVQLKTGAHAWWKTATKDQLHELYARRADTLRRRKNDQRSQKLHSVDLKIAFKAYRAEVDYLTEKTFRKYRKDINPQNLRRGFAEHHLDHKYSVLQGFINQVDPRVISSRHNLQLITQAENLRKNSSCSIALEELVRLYEKEP